MSAFAGYEINRISNYLEGAVLPGSHYFLFDSPLALDFGFSNGDKMRL